MLRTVMDFSWDWVKPGPVATTEPLVKAKLELARTAMQQATPRLIVASPPVLGRRGEGRRAWRRPPPRLFGASPPVLERREQRSRQRLRLPAACRPQPRQRR